jgi:hypothetical protein
LLDRLFRRSARNPYFAGMLRQLFVYGPENGLEKLVVEV